MGVYCCSPIYISGLAMVNTMIFYTVVMRC